MIDNTLSCSKVLNLAFEMILLAECFLSVEMLRLSGVAARLVLSLVEVEDGLRDGTADSSDGGKHVADAAELSPVVQLFQRTEIQAFTISPLPPSSHFLYKHLIKRDRLNIRCRCNCSQATRNLNFKKIFHGKYQI